MALSRILNSLLVEQRAAKSELHSAQTVRLACRMFIDRLPPGARLEPVTLNGAAEGKTLADIRAEIAAVRAELATLRSAPVPSSDIRKRVEFLCCLARRSDGSRHRRWRGSADHLAWGAGNVIRAR